MLVESECATINAVGYEGVTIERFIKCLSRNEIQAIIDVRANPISRKPGFSKKALEERLTEEGFRYFHYPELGIPSRIRKQYENINDLLDYYDREILPTVVPYAQEVVDICRMFNSAILCFEADARCCHRSRLARFISNEFHLRQKYIDSASLY